MPGRTWTPIPNSNPPTIRADDGVTVWRDPATEALTARAPDGICYLDEDELIDAVDVLDGMGRAVSDPADSPA